MKHETTAISTFPVADAPRHAGANQEFGMAKQAVSKCNHCANAGVADGKDAYARLGDAIKEAKTLIIVAGLLVLAWAVL